MELSKLIVSDEELNVIDNGAWVGDIPGAEGVELLVTGWVRNDEAQTLLRVKMESFVKDNSREPDDKEKADITREILAEVVLKGWRGITDNGKQVAYKKSLAKKWLTSRNGEMLAVMTLNSARRIDEKASSFVETVAKN